jgi:LCP family protein required for cell wall assembly
LRRAAVVIAAGLISVGLASYLLRGRVAHLEVRLPHDHPGDTWILVGSDSRDRLETDAGYLVGEGKPDGARADIVMAVRMVDGVATALAIPRDVIVGSASGSPVRLAHTLDPDPQELVDALCVDLGIAADHIAIMDMEGLIDLVDAMGGVDVDLPHAIRDEAAGLDLPSGPQQLDGASALGLVRSRKSTELRGERWVSTDDGHQRRMRSANEVFSAIGNRADSLWRDPVRASRTAWVAAGAVTLDRGSGLFDLAGLRAPEDITILPTEKPSQARALRLTDDAPEVVSRFTGSESCSL